MHSKLKLTQRPRRNRKSFAIRNLVQETQLTSHDFIAPYFITRGRQVRSPIQSLPNQFHLSSDSFMAEIEELLNLGISSILLFPVVPVELKDSVGSYAINADNHLLDCIQKIKKQAPELCICADVALDPFTTHGHDGLIDSHGHVLNDETIHQLVEMSLLFAEAGVDVIAPSDMMDGRVSAIRKELDERGYTQTSIMSYTAKYASSLYGPFRDALSSGLLKGDKKSYQMNPANKNEALREAELDEQEGADILMVKPATLYLDVISAIKQNTHLPVAAYHVSGEYSMLKLASEKGWLNFESALIESLISIKRAGADIMITYGAKEAASWIKAI